jgi:hypothetical protein
MSRRGLEESLAADRRREAAATAASAAGGTGSKKGSRGRGHAAAKGGSTPKGSCGGGSQGAMAGAALGSGMSMALDADWLLGTWGDADGGDGCGGAEPADDLGEPRRGQALPFTPIRRSLSGCAAACALRTSHPSSPPAALPDVAPCAPAQPAACRPGLPARQGRAAGGDGAGDRAQDQEHGPWRRPAARLPHRLCALPRAAAGGRRRRRRRRRLCAAAGGRGDAGGLPAAAGGDRRVPAAWPGGPAGGPQGAGARSGLGWGSRPPGRLVPVLPGWLAPALPR